MERRTNNDYRPGYPPVDRGYQVPGRPRAWFGHRNFEGLPANSYNKSREPYQDQINSDNSANNVQSTCPYPFPSQHKNWN